MMKKIFIPLLVTFLCFYVTVISASAVPFATLNVLDTNIRVGESFDVEVWVDGDGLPASEELLAFGFDTVTSGTLFSYDSYTIESGFFDASDPFNSDNVAGSVFPGIPDNNVLLATLSFTAISDGTDTLQVLGIADGLFYGLFYENVNTFVQSDFNINIMTDINVAPVPEPATIFLLGFGLIGLIWFRRKNIKSSQI